MRLKLLLMISIIFATTQVWAASVGFSDRGYHMTPVIEASVEALDFGPVEVGYPVKKQLVVTGYDLTDNINLEVQARSVNYYKVTPQTITPEQAANGANVTVTYAPTAAGETQATLTLSCADEDVEDVIVPITGVAQPRVPTLIVDPSSLNFNAALDKTLIKTISLTGAFLTNDITVTLNDENNVFTVSPTSISKNNTNVNTPVNVTVSFSSPVEGSFSGSITFASNGAESKTVQLTGVARDGGSAIDPYLNIANYETIDEAGATVSGMSTIYKYTEYEEEECAWLTLSNYGATKADASQNWYETSSLTQYSNDWDDSDIFLGDQAYFGSNNSYSVYGSGNQSFYVSNCTQVKALVKGGSYGSSNATLSIYMCSLNADGSLTPSTTAVDTKQGSNGVITSAALDASNIYMVKIAGGGSYPDLLEIGFQTPLANYPVPVATEATEIGAHEFTANWTACEGADSYILRIAPKNYDILTESFSKFTKAGSVELSGSLDDYMDNAGWTGSKLYEAVGGIRMGTGSSPSASVVTAIGLDHLLCLAP